MDKILTNLLYRINKEQKANNPKTKRGFARCCLLWQEYREVSNWLNQFHGITR